MRQENLLALGQEAAEKVLHTERVFDNATHIKLLRVVVSQLLDQPLAFPLPHNEAAAVLETLLPAHVNMAESLYGME